MAHRFKAFPQGGRWIAGAKAEARRMRGRVKTDEMKKQPLISRYATGSRGEALIGHRRHFERSREILYNRNGTTRTRAGSPSRYCTRLSFSGVSQKIPAEETVRHALVPARLPAGVLCRPPLSNFRASFQIPATSVLRDLRKRRSRSVRTPSPRTNRSERSIIRIFWRVRKTARRRRRERQP